MKSVVMVCRAWIPRMSVMPGISRIPWMSVVAAVRAVVTVVAWTVVTVVAWTVMTVVARSVVTVVSWLSLRIAVGTASSAGVSGGCSSAVAGVLCYHIGCRHR